ncbi:hypothetical protein DRN58_04930 [Thermococci archaeon]|nr:MAG: hypothetical protein DRN58_04930 [Thermococci archaeon]
MLEELRVFISGSVVSYKALFTWLNPRDYVAIKIIMPLFQISFFALVSQFAGGREAMKYAVIGNAIQLVAINDIYGVSMTIGREKMFGTLPFILASPANRFSIFMGHSFVHIFDGILNSLFGLTIAWGVFRVHILKSQIAILILILFVTSFGLSGLGMIIGSLSLYTRGVRPLMNTVYMLLLLLSGVNIPISALPSCIRSISIILPLTHGIKAARGVISGDTTLLDISFEIFLTGIIGVFFLIIGYYCFLLFEKKAYKEGTFEYI